MSELTVPSGIEDPVGLASGIITESVQRRRRRGIALRVGAGAAGLSLLAAACTPAETTAQPSPHTATAPPCGDLAPPLITGSYAGDKLPVDNTGNPVCVYSRSASDERIGIIPAPGALDLLCRSFDGDSVLVSDLGVISSTGVVYLSPAAQLETKPGGSLHQLTTSCPPPAETSPTPPPTGVYQLAIE
jgi:hypothetical protein